MSKKTAPGTRAKHIIGTIVRNQIAKYNRLGIWYCFHAAGAYSLIADANLFRSSSVFALIRNVRATTLILLSSSYNNQNIISVEASLC